MHRLEGAIEFSIHTDERKIPDDSLYNGDFLGWLTDARTIFHEILNWRHIEIGEPIDVCDEEKAYEGFEIFGPTLRGSACRIWYAEDIWLNRKLEGIISAKTQKDAEEDVKEIREAFTGLRPSYIFNINPVRGYP